MAKSLVTAPVCSSIPVPVLPEESKVEIMDSGLTENITTPTARKVNDMSVLLVRLGINFDAVMAFGAYVKDIEILQRSGAAVENVVSEAKVCSARVTLPKREDGMAVVVEELVVRLLGREPLLRIVGDPLIHPIPYGSAKTETLNPFPMGVPSRRKPCACFPTRSSRTNWSRVQPAGKTGPPDIFSIDRSLPSHIS